MKAIKKPENFIISDLKWKFLIRNILKNKNTLITGPSGFGKTLLVQLAAEQLSPQFKFFIIPMGSTQDPRSSLIGNTHYEKNSGTYFVESFFIKAIQTPNSIILLDEINRGHLESSNILIPITDYNTRYIRLDESPDTPLIHVAENVSFIATCNIGLEYSGTKALDRALLTRFLKFEIDFPTFEEEVLFLKTSFGNVDKKIIESIVKIAHFTRDDVRSEDSRLSNLIPVKTTLEIVSLIEDGFALSEIAELMIYPMFPDEGGCDSERVFVKQIVQKYLPVKK
jgi:MoxR-like ATPase